MLGSRGVEPGPAVLDDASANHPFLPSAFHRQGEFCGTCHDVSNPVTGDLAHNFGAQVALQPGTYSGDPDSPLDQKAQFQNPPYAYGVIERTFSEWKASALDTFVVNDFATLPADLRVSGGALDIAYHRAYDARSDANYEDGTYDYWDEPRFTVPVGAEEVTVRLFYQQTSWEYIQFLWLQNDGLSPFLGQEGVNMLDAWLNTGMSPPLEMGAVTLTVAANPMIFADGYESGDTSAWSIAIP